MEEVENSLCFLLNCCATSDSIKFNMFINGVGELKKSSDIFYFRPMYIFMPYFFLFKLSLRLKKYILPLAILKHFCFLCDVTQIHNLNGK